MNKTYQHIVGEYNMIYNSIYSNPSDNIIPPYSSKVRIKPSQPSLIKKHFSSNVFIYDKLSVSSVIIAKSALTSFSIFRRVSDL